MNNHSCPRIYRGLLAGVILAAAWLLSARSARANNPPVSNTADSGPGSLRDAIANAPYYGTITFDPSVTGTITLTSGELGIIGNLTIIGPGASLLTVSGNNASRIFNIAPSGTATISGLSISAGENQGADSSSGNGAPGEGGGIFNAGNLTLTDCTVSQNQVLGGQGGTYGGGGLGGGIYSSGTLTLVNCLITQNSAVGGAGTVVLSSTDGLGGGIFSQGALALTNCTVSWNAASGGGDVFFGSIFGGDGDGGGLYVVQMGLFANCTIANNSAYGEEGFSTPGNHVPAGFAQGGGLFVENDNPTQALSLTVILTSCTISGNFCVGGGVNSPLAGAPGGAFGGGIYAGSTSSYAPAVAPTLNNTIVSDNVVVGGYGSGGPNGEATGPDVYGDFASGGFNLIGAADGSFGWIASGNGADLTGTTNAPMNAQLGQLQNNGGATPTLALASTSPAVDKGCGFGLTTDQRGSPRAVDFLGLPHPAGGDWSDIGAFELKRPFLNIAVVATENLVSLLKIGWSETEANKSTSPMMASPPLYGVEESADAMFGQPMTSTMAVWMRNGRYELRDGVMPQGAYYRLSTAVANPFIPPAATTAATAISSNAATLNGTTTPYGLSTAYWFEYGADTNYGICTQTNGLATSTNLASLSCAIGGLASSAAVHFQLVVADDDGIQVGGDQSFMTLSNVPPPPPPLPLLVTLAATSVNANSAVLNGTIEGNGSYAVAHFQYGLDTNYTSGEPVFSYFTTQYYDVESFSYTLAGLAPNTTYHYQTFGFNCCEEGFGGDQTFTTAAGPAQPPPTVGTLAASSVTKNSATLNGSANPNGGASTAFFEWGTDANYGNITTQTGIGTAPQNDFQAFLSGLNSYTTYHYRIDAVNSGGTTYGADESFTTVWAPVPPTLVSPGTSTPGSPGLASTAPTFTWTGASPASSFDLIILGYPKGDQVFAGSVEGSSYTLPSGILADETAYQWYMVAFDSLGDESVESSPLYFTTAALPTVVTLPATNVVGSFYVKLSGSVNPNGGGTTVYFEYGTTASYGTITTQTGIGTATEIFTATIGGLTAGTTYHYRIDAVNGLGLSSGSDVTFVAP